MPEALDHLRGMMRDATVLIRGIPEQGAVDASKPWGSGFFIAPGKVLTCAHVFCQWERGLPVWRGDEEVGITYRPGTGGVATAVGRLVHCLPGADEVPEDKRGSWPTPDLAVVELTEPVEHACVWLSDRSTPPSGIGEKLLYLGFTLDEHGSPSNWEGNCGISGTNGDHVLRLDGGGGAVKGGLSGGPVVDLGRGAVVGVIKARRHDHDGGNAVRITALRELSSAGPQGEDPYQDLILDHDRWHWLNQRDNGPHTHTWASVQSALPKPGTRWLPPDRLEALWLLAQLPQAPDPGTVERLVEDACPNQRITGSALPHSWRDGAGLLYDAYPVGEEKAILSYLIRVARRERAKAPVEATALSEWALARAERAKRAKSLHENDWNELAALARPPKPVELRARRPERDAVPPPEPSLVPKRADLPPVPGRAVPPEPAIGGAEVRDLPPVTAAYGPLRPPRPLRPPGLLNRPAAFPPYDRYAPPTTSAAISGHGPHDATGSGPESEPVDALDDFAAVLLDFRAEWWLESHYSWTVRLVGHTGDVELMDEGPPLHARKLGGPPQELLDALRQAFLRADAGEHIAPLEVLLPQELFDIPVDDWMLERASRQETPRLGAVRAVTVVDQRSFDRPTSGPGARWTAEPRRPADAARPLATAPLLAPGARGSTDAIGTVLFHSGPVGTGRAGEMLRHVLDLGPAAVVWRREEAPPDLRERFATEVGRLVSGVRTLAGLPGAVAALRASVDPDDPDSRWAHGLAVLHDPERRPAMTTDLLDTP